MPEPKDERDREDVRRPDRPEPGNEEATRDERVKGVTRLPRKGDELDDLRGTPTD